MQVFKYFVCCCNVLVTILQKLKLISHKTVASPASFVRSIDGRDLLIWKAFNVIYLNETVSWHLPAQIEDDKLMPRQVHCNKEGKGSDFYNSSRLKRTNNLNSAFYTSKIWEDCALLFHINSYISESCVPRKASSLWKNPMRKNKNNPSWFPRVIHVEELN